jgi:Tetracyclin repressor-like, C-terminal domain
VTGELDDSAIPPISSAMAAQAEPVAGSVMPGVPLAVVARSLAVWAFLLGQISFEVFGRLDDVVQDREVLFDFAVATMLDMVGISPAAPCQ